MFKDKMCKTNVAPSDGLFIYFIILLSILLLTEFDW